MSCRHNLANGTCIRCYPTNPYNREESHRIDPGPEDNYEPNLEGPGAAIASDSISKLEQTCEAMIKLEKQISDLIRRVRHLEARNGACK